LVLGGKWSGLLGCGLGVELGMFFMGVFCLFLFLFGMDFYLFGMFFRFLIGSWFGWLTADKVGFSGF
jgi:hypothetical protein